MMGRVTVEGQPAYKPGSVRRLSPPGDHSSGTPLARRLKQPTRTTGPERPGGFPPRRSYSVLLPVGFALPSPLLETRWALTPPFHPYLRPKPKAVCFLWHFPWGHPRRALPGTVSPWSPDFPPPPSFDIGRERPPGRLACVVSRAGGPLSSVGRLRAKPEPASPSRNSGPKWGSCVWNNGRHCI